MAIGNTPWEAAQSALKVNHSESTSRPVYPTATADKEVAGNSPALIEAECDHFVACTAVFLPGSG